MLQVSNTIWHASDQRVLYDSCVLSETTLRLLWVVPPFDDFGLTDLTDTDRAAERREAIFGPFGVIGVKVDLEGVNG